MISLHYTSDTKAYNTIYAACNIVEAIYSFTTCCTTHNAVGSDVSTISWSRICTSMRRAVTEIDNFLVFDSSPGMMFHRSICM